MGLQCMTTLQAPVEGKCSSLLGITVVLWHATLVEGVMKTARYEA